MDFVEVVFTLGKAETEPGEVILIVGDTVALGTWNPLMALRLETEEATYPAWTARLMIPLPTTGPKIIEYKYVKDCRGGGGTFEWEASIPNRSIQIPDDSRIRVWSVMDQEFNRRKALLIPQPALPKSASALDVDDFKIQEDADDCASTGAAEEGGATASLSDSSEVICMNIPPSINREDGGMARITSLSALDQLINEPEELAQLRGQMDDAMEDRPVRYGARHLETPVVIVTSELHPWSKTGGLAMVAGSYGYEFALRGHRTMAIAPMYGDYSNVECIGEARLWLGGGHHTVRYFHQYQAYGHGKGCDYVFVEHECYKRSEGIYGPPGGEYADNLFRFALLSLAAAEAPLILTIRGAAFGQDVLFIANDWQTGLLPLYLLYKYKRNLTYQRARSMMVIHNIGYQGKYNKSAHPVGSFLGLPPDAEYDLAGEDMHMGHNCINLLAGGIRVADRVLTVSPNYAGEIQTPEGGNGLHEILRDKAQAWRVAGILNGIADEWNPITDKFIPRNYGLRDFEEGKRYCKAMVQRELGLHEDPGACLIGFCGRLCYQKGLNLILGNVPWMMDGHGVGRVQIILMGKGDPEYSRRVAEMEGRFRQRVCGYVGFDPKVEHKMMAGCDLLLMPSQYEPCGLPQMYAQQYGTLPIVHETGGLKDSVKGLWDEQHDVGHATGFLFRGFSEGEMQSKVHHALEVYHHRHHIFRQMQDNAMRSNFYWPHAMDEYEKHLDWTMEA
eukprot:CAMPEP_0178408052 /NCGR_PEP_ID=MMETSP0689_2-20121128/19742_1 /TAXON_ID=160604 /ORGANISM="Amphidinium massartii, Strain CS-259" /LENGTH=729 /DNA_ID=CAMNT_0020029139 /DNA_START=93 /DNA_END=2278 /DNA_ORIENTATION=-